MRHFSFGAQFVAGASITHSVAPAYCVTKICDVPSQPVGQSYFIGGGGLHVGVGWPGAAVGQLTRSVAVQVAPCFVTNQTLLVDAGAVPVFGAPPSTPVVGAVPGPVGPVGRGGFATVT